MSGLGIVPETLQLSRLPGYHIGGSVHVVINNQVGFTTLPAQGRSSLHCTDCAKAAGLPIIHAFADSPDSVVAAMQTAARWRHRFRSDIVVDVCGYRRNGHNEQDDPALTLPMTQRLIRQQPSVVSCYAEQLIRDAVVSQGELEGWQDKIQSRLEDGGSSCCSMHAPGVELFSLQCPGLYAQIMASQHLSTALMAQVCADCHASHDIR